MRVANRVTRRSLALALPQRAASIGLMALLLGCAAIEQHPLVAKDTATAFRARTIDADGLRAYATKPVTGFTFWPPVSLDARALDTIALYYNPAIAVARDKWLAAKAGIVTADQLPNPTLAVEPLNVTTGATAGVSPWVVAASLTQIIETAGKRGIRVARAQYLAESARLDLLNTAWDTVGNVHQALLNVAIEQQRVAALSQQVAAQSDLVEVTQKLVKSGLESGVTLATVQTAFSKATIDLESAKAALIEAHHRLAQAVGLPADAIDWRQLSLALAPEPLTPAFRDEVRQTAELNRADLLAKLAAYAASDASLQLEAARRFPDVEIGPGYEYDQGQQKWGLSLSVSLPIFNQNQGAIGEAVAARNQAADEFIALQAEVIGNIDQAIAAYDAALSTLNTAEALAATQARLLHTQQALFKRGEIDRVVLIAARVDWASSELARIEALGNFAKARLALETAAQRYDGMANPIAPLNLDAVATTTSAGG